MRCWPVISFRIACLAIFFALAACAFNSGPQVDPIFHAVPGGRYACADAPQGGNSVVAGLTSPIAQAALGGAVGGLIGNQFGSHNGNKIATGAGAAAGVAAGAWNARRMENNRYRQCEQRQPRRY